MKKAFWCVGFLLLFLSAILPSIYGMEETKEITPVVTVSSVTGYTDYCFDLNISIEGNTGITGAIFSVEYDSSVMRLVNVVRGDAFSSLEMAELAVPYLNPLVLSWDGLYNDTTNGTMVTLSFAVKADAPVGQYPVTLTYIPGDIYDENYEDLSVQVMQGQVTIETMVCGDVNKDGRINGKDITMIRRLLSDGTQPSEYISIAADVNVDNVINGKDVTLIRRYISGGFGVVLGNKGTNVDITNSGFVNSPYLNGCYLYFTPKISGTLYYSFMNDNTISAWMAPIKELQENGSNNVAATLSTYSEISRYLTQVSQGNYTTVTVGGSISQQSMFVNVNTAYKYMAVWLVSSDGNTMFQPYFISLSGYTDTPETGSGTNDSGTLPTTESGFAYDPIFGSSYYNLSTMKQTGTISLLSYAGGLVEYYYTNDTTSSLTSSQFSVNWQAAYAANSEYTGYTYLAPSTASYISISQPYSSYLGQNTGMYKYVWIRLTDTSVSPNTPCVPVRVQLY